MTERWDEDAGRIERVAGETVASGTAEAERGAFVHRVGVPGPGEIQVDVVLAAGRCVSRVLRVGTGDEPITAVRDGARKLERTVAAARALAEEIEAAAADRGSRRGPQLRRKLERVGMLREGWAGGPVGAARPVLDEALSDLECAIEGVEARGGKVLGRMGRPFAAASVGEKLLKVEEIALREQAIFLVREAESVRKEIARGAASGCPFAWSRVQSAASRSLGALTALQQDLETGRFGNRYRELTEVEEQSVGRLVDGVRDFLDRAEAAVECPASVERELEELQASLSRQAERLESQLRAVK
jgi:hypothetical protein